MTNMDEDGYPSDNSYINSVGPTPAWECWNSGEWLCEPVNSELGQVLHGNPGGNQEDEMCIWTPVSGGYGSQKHTFIAEFPNRFLAQITV